MVFQGVVNTVKWSEQRAALPEFVRVEERAAKTCTKSEQKTALPDSAMNERAANTGRSGQRIALVGCTRVEERAAKTGMSCFSIDTPVESNINLHVCLDLSRCGITCPKKLSKLIHSPPPSNTTCTFVLVISRVHQH